MSVELNGMSQPVERRLELGGHRLHAVDKAASRFRDLMPSKQNQEMYAKIAYAVGAALLAIGMAVAIYYCVKGSYHYQLYSPVRNAAGAVVRDAWGYVKYAPSGIGTASTAPFAVFPGMFGTIGVTGLITGFFMTNFETSRNGRSKDFSKAGAKEEELKTLTEKTLSEIYKRYHKANGGVGPLVTNGLIREAEGVEMMKLLRSHETQLKIKEGFESTRSHSAEFVEDAKANPRKYPAYKAALDEIADQEAAWDRLQGRICDHYSAGPSDSVVLDSDSDSE